jgi:hypothetical protein
MKFFLIINFIIHKLIIFKIKNHLFLIIFSSKKIFLRNFKLIIKFKGKLDGCYCLSQFNNEIYGSLKDLFPEN